MPKNSLNWNLVPGIELSPEIPTENMSQVWWSNSSNSEFTVSHIVSDGPTITYLPNICFSIFMPIAFLPSKIPKPYLQQSLFFLCWKGEHFGHFGEPPSFHGSFPRICVVKFLFDFLLLICLMLILLFDQSEELTIEDNVLSPTDSNHILTIYLYPLINLLHWANRFYIFQRKCIFL